MARRLRRVLMAVLGAVFLFSVCFIIVVQYEYKESQKLYQGAAEQFTASAPGSTSGGSAGGSVADNGTKGGSGDRADGPDNGSGASGTDIPGQAFPDRPPITVDFRALEAVNGDVCGWIYCPDTPINYPVLQGEDNDTYLHHSYDGAYAAAGSIFVEALNRPDFADANTILYGHHMRNGSMFALFAELRDSDIFNEHRTIYLLTPEGNYRLQTFAVEHVPMTHSSIATPNYATDQEFSDFKQWLLDESIVAPDNDVAALVTDATKLFGFCTCDGADNTWRYITFAAPAEFVPIAHVGTGDYHSDLAVEDEAAADIAGDVSDRTE